MGGRRTPDVSLYCQAHPSVCSLRGIKLTREIEIEHSVSKSQHDDRISREKVSQLIWSLRSTGSAMSIEIFLMSEHRTHSSSEVAQATYLFGPYKLVLRSKREIHWCLFEIRVPFEAAKTAIHVLHGMMSTLQPTTFT